MTWFWGNEDGEVTAILGSDGEQVFETARFLAVQVGESKTYSSHPLENGKVATDNEVENQDRINLQLILEPENYVEVFQEIKTLYEAGEAFFIQTRVDTYSNMYIESMPHDEGPAIANTIGLSLSLVEQEIAGSNTQILSSSDVSSSADESTIKSGQKTSTPTVLDSTAQAVSNFFGSLF
jgi:hypothetical protein